MLEERERRGKIEHLRDDFEPLLSIEDVPSSFTGDRLRMREQDTDKFCRRRLGLGNQAATSKSRWTARTCTERPGALYERSEIPDAAGGLTHSERNVNGLRHRA
jgi:hypothetical protein